jgi:hypothetical protein
MTRQVLERSVELQAEYIVHIETKFTSEQLVLVDERVCGQRISILGFAYATQGHQATRKAFLFEEDGFCHLRQCFSHIP